MAVVDDLLPSKDNPRIMSDEQAELDSDGLLTSIKALGVIQPVQVRNHPTEKGKKEILAGERRWRCSRVAGHETILSLDYGEMAEDEAFRITCIENAHRRDLRPLEQGRAAAIALGRCGGDVKAAAALLGQTPRWIAMGAKIHEGLVETWRKGLMAESELRHWTAGHVALIARFPACVQEDLYKSILCWWQAEKISIEDLANLTADALRVLAAAPFDTAGCADCDKRSGRQHLLWSDDEGEATGKNERCLDAACWRKKETEHYQAAFADKAREYKGLVAVDLGKGGDYQREQELKRIYGDHLVEMTHHGAARYEVVKAETKGAVPALVVAGTGKGSIRYIKRVKAAASTPPGKSKADTQAEKGRQRLLLAVRDRIKREIEAISIEELLASQRYMAGMIFCSVFFGGSAVEMRGEERAELFRGMRDAGEDVLSYLYGRMWGQTEEALFEGMLCDWQVTGCGAEGEENLQYIAEAFGWSYSGLLSEVTAALAQQDRIAEKTEVVKLGLSKSLKASCELRIVEDGGKLFAGLHIEIPKAKMDVPVTLDGENYESRVLAVKAMAEAAAKWLSEQKAKKVCPAALYKIVAGEISEVVGACELELVYGCTGPASQDAGHEPPATVHASKPSGVIDGPEQIRVPMETAWHAAITIKIAQVEGLWYVGWDAHVPGAGDAQSCSTANMGCTFRNDALSHAHAWLAVWLDGKPGRKGYKHHAAILEAVRGAIRDAMDDKSGKAACSADPETCGVGCVPCTGTLDRGSGPLLNTAKTIASGRITSGVEPRLRRGDDDRTGPPSVDSPRGLAVAFPNSYKASCEICIQRVAGQWRGGFDVKAMSGGFRHPVGSPGDKSYATKGECLCSMQEQIRTWLMEAAGDYCQMKSRAVRIAARIEGAVQDELAKRTCRVCGCTEDNCQGCIERTGAPCTWIEADLCSACVQPGAETQKGFER
jgi:ParB/RepB/Spo0J family partition protein